MTVIPGGRRIAATLAATGLLLTASSCGFGDVNSRPLPFSVGGGPDDLRVTVVLENAANLVPNAEVRYRDVEVGSIRTIRYDDWHAVLTIGVEKDADIPATVIASVAQKSLLGAEYLDLADPAEAPAAAGTTSAPAARLADGATIGLGRSGRYPETEEVLSAAALLLNNGGLPQIRTIAHELNAMLDGRVDEVRAWVRQVTRFAAGVDAQREEITTALEGLDRFALAVRSQAPRLDRALRKLPRGVDAVRRERSDLVAALASVDRLAGSTHVLVRDTRVGLQRNLADLRPVTGALAAHADRLADAMDSLSFPLPVRSIDKGFFGDYINFFPRMDLPVADTARFFADGYGLGDLLGVVARSSGGLFGRTTTGGAR